MVKCTFCGEEEAIMKIPDPNDMGSKKEWNVCWECDQYIKWSYQLMFARHFGIEIKPFDEWLFEKEGVYPKHESLACVLKKNVVNQTNRV